MTTRISYPLDADAFDGQALLDRANGGTNIVDILNQLLQDSEAPHASLLSIGPVAAKGTTDVHALYDNTNAEFPGPFTNPDVPRNLRVTFSASWDGGDVTVYGTNQFDEVISEVFADVAGTTVVGTKIFKTVNRATKQTPAGVAGNGASIGTGDLLGVPAHLADEVGQLWVGATGEAVTLDDTLSSFAPTTVPAATTYTLLVNIDPTA
jgi:hypothetical protein